METVAEDGGKGPQTEHYDGADGARSENGMHRHREYNILASKATEGGHASAGAANREDGHGAMEEREGPRREEEGMKTHSARSPRRNPTDERSRRGSPTNSRASLTREATAGGGGGGEPPTEKRALTACSGGK